MPLPSGPDDRPRRWSSPGGVPMWLWAAMGSVVLALLGCMGLGALAFINSRREARVTADPVPAVADRPPEAPVVPPARPS